MKLTILTLFVTIFLFSCDSSNTTETANETDENSTEENEVEDAETNNAEESIDISGKWQLVSFTKTDSEEELYTDCDANTIWNFTTEEDEPLGDGTAVSKLLVSAPEECKFYDFDAKWTISNDQLFMSSTRIGGIGGYSGAGLFSIESFDGNSLKLSHMKKANYEFSKLQ